VHFQLAMLAYHLNCWLLFNRDEGVKADDLEYTTMATARLRFLFVAAKIWRHAGRVGIRSGTATSTRSADCSTEYISSF
jgi:hypothetical protein